jgi:radical SAM protein with 4Fe4S-binding SPASM domain
LKLTAAITIPACVFDDPARPPIPLGVCSLVGPRTTVTVGPDGAVRSCAMSGRTAGVLGETPWPEIARNLWEQELRPLREALPEACRRCPAHPRCLGGCRLAALAAGGRADALDPLVPR